MSKQPETVENHPASDQPDYAPGAHPPDTAWPVVEAIEPDDDVLLSLTPEDEVAKPVAPGRPSPAPRPPGPRRPLPLAIGLAVVAAAAGAAWYFIGPARVPPVVTGTLSIETQPAGAVVAIDGKVYGASPLTTALTPGRHLVELTGSGKREVTVTIEAGARLAQYVEMPAAFEPGRLRVETAPPGAQVTVDGIPRGVTPLDVDGLAPGAHVVTLRNGTATVTQNVTVQPGVPVSLVVPLANVPNEAGQAGTVAVVSPVELQVFEGERFLGTSRTDQIMMLAGRHELRLVNQEVGYEVTRAVQVAPGRTSTVKVDLPNGALFVNALPWAEVFVDGSKIGETPIANYLLPLGSHEVVLRNPRFAEQRRTVVVSLKAPVRIGVDLRK